MSPLPTNVLDRRDASPGRTFSTVFAVIAVLVILGCLILVIILPKYRKKPRTIPGSRYPVVPNYPHPFGPPPRFPSHPALLRGFRKKPPVNVPRYDPRVESPFPSSTTQLNASGHLKPVAVQSYGLTTPPQWCFAITSRQPKKPHYTPEAATHNGGPDPRHFTTFSTKHDYILPVPEPLILKPRPAGRPPPLTRQLERFPMPLPISSCRNKGLMHPVKLFRELDQKHSDATADNLGTPCPLPQNHKRPRAMELLVVESEARTDEAKRSDGLASSTVEDQKSLEQESRPVIGKLRSHQKDTDDVDSKTSSRREARLERMGTLARPKTPVAELRKRFDQAASNTNKEKSSPSKQLYTPASDPFTTPGLSSTPPTSPGLTTDQTPLPSTPSKPNLGSLYVDIISHTQRRTPSSVMLPSAEKLTALPHAPPNRRIRQAAQGSPPEKVVKKRANTSRLKFGSWSILRPNVRISRRYSSSSLSTMCKPILGPRSQYSQGASSASVYSRDAKALSLLEAIQLPVKGAVSPHVKPARTRNLPSARRSESTHKQSASIDYLKTKIDNWDLHTDNMSPSSAVKRSISDTGPRRATAHVSTLPHIDNSVQGKRIPLIQIGRSSDDVFGIEADGFSSDRTSILMKRLARVETSPVILGGLGHGTAPGGGQWI